MSSIAIITMKIPVVMRTKSRAFSKSLEPTVFSIFLDSNRQKIGIEQVRQPLEAPLAVGTYSEKDLHLCELFYNFFSPGQCSTTLSSEVRLMQIVLQSVWQDAVAKLETTAPSVPEVESFFSSTAMEENISRAKSLMLSGS